MVKGRGEGRDTDMRRDLDSGEDEATRPPRQRVEQYMRPDHNGG